MVSGIKLANEKMSYEVIHLTTIYVCTGYHLHGLLYITHFNNIDS